jgi:hypothetical protein
VPGATFRIDAEFHSWDAARLRASRANEGGS